MDWKSRQYCNDLIQLEAQSPVHLYGFVDTIRDHGQVLFIHIRDVSGIIQMVFDPEKHPEIYKIAQTLRSEWVISINGLLQKRSIENVNPNIPFSDNSSK